MELLEFVDTYKSPFGNLNIYCSAKGITRISREEPPQVLCTHDFIGQAKRELDEYFAGSRKTFDVAIDFIEGTDFQKSVWQELQNIPFGMVISYSDLAVRCGDIKKVRAVGKANGANPIPIIVPCHRVIGKGGKLVGFSQGLDMKQELLSLENAPIMGQLF